MKTPKQAAEEYVNAEGYDNEEFYGPEERDAVRNVFLAGVAWGIRRAVTEAHDWGDVALCCIEGSDWEEFIRMEERVIAFGDFKKMLLAVLHEEEGE